MADSRVHLSKRRRGLCAEEDRVSSYDASASSAAPAMGSATAVTDDPTLSLEQQAVLRAVRNGDNIFLTGSAGVGKSVTLRAIIRTLREMHGHDCVAVCASTGIAAEPLGGSTLHSFAACGLGEYYKNFMNILSKEHRSRITACAALVIDGEWKCV